jgi:hypothetical protein
MRSAAWVGTTAAKSERAVIEHTKLMFPPHDEQLIKSTALAFQLIGTNNISRL